MDDFNLLFPIIYRQLDLKKFHTPDTLKYNHIKFLKNIIESWCFAASFLADHLILIIELASNITKKYPQFDKNLHI